MGQCRRVIWAILGVLGSGICLGAIVVTWIGRDRLGQSATWVLESAQVTLKNVDRTVQRTSMAVSALRTELNAPGAAARAEALADSAGDLQELMGAARSSAEMARSVVDAIAQVPLTLPTRRGEGIAARLTRLPALLEDAEHTLLSVEEGLRARALDAKATGGMHTHLGRLETRLAHIVKQVEEAQQDLSRLREHLPGWLTTTAVLLTIFFVWMGVGQRCLATRGRAAGTVA